MMTHATVYSTQTCPYCVAAKNLLAKKNIQYQEINVAQDKAQYEAMLQRTNRRTVPQIFLGDQYIGGYTDLVAHFKQA